MKTLLEIDDQDAMTVSLEVFQLLVTELDALGYHRLGHAYRKFREYLPSAV